MDTLSLSFHLIAFLADEAFLSDGIQASTRVEAENSVRIQTYTVIWDVPKEEYSWRSCILSLSNEREEALDPSIRAATDPLDLSNQ